MAFTLSIESEASTSSVIVLPVRVLTKICILRPARVYAGSRRAPPPRRGVNEDGRGRAARSTLA